MSQPSLWSSNVSDGFLTWVGREHPPGTLRSCWRRSWPPRWRLWMGGACLVPGSGGLRASWKRSGAASVKTEPTIILFNPALADGAEAPYRQPSSVSRQAKLGLAATCLSAAFAPAHLVPDVPGRRRTPARTDKNEHVLKEECEGNKRKRGKTRLRVDNNTRNGVSCWWGHGKFQANVNF